MIKPVSETSSFEVTKQQKKSIFAQKKINENSPYLVRYADSFVRHSVESAPVLGGLTVFWSFVDKSRFGTMKKALTYNTKNFLLPVMLITSGITAFIDNRKAKTKKQNPEK